MRRSRLFAGVVVALGMSFSAAADAVDDVIKKLDEANAKIKSYTAKMKMDQKMDMGGMKSSTEMSGNIEFARKGGKEMIRTDMDSKMTTEGGGADMKIVQKSLMVSDGEFMYMLVDTIDGPMKGKNCTKNKAQADSMSAKNIKAMGDAKALPDAKIEGEDCYVFEVMMKQGMPGMKQVLSYRKSDGIAAKVVTIMNEKEIGTMTMSDIKVNTEIPADRFVWKAPEGVECVDMTKPMEGESTPVKP